MLWTKRENPGEDVWFEELYRAHFMDLKNLAGAILKKHGSRYASASGREEEVVQEMFAFAWEHRDKVRASPNPAGWLYRSTIFKALEFIREDRLWNKRLLQMSERLPESGQEDFRLRVELRSIIPEEDYLLLKTLYLDGYTYNEISAYLGLKKSALAMRIKRSKARIRADHDAAENAAENRA